MAAKGKDAAPVIDFDSPEYDAQFEDATSRLQDRLETATAITNTHLLEQDARRQVLEQAVEATLASALTTIDMLYMARDDDAVTTTSLVNGSWDPEPEPEPCAVDNWLRATIPETQQPKQSYMLNEFLKGASGRVADLRRSSSQRSTGTRASQSGIPGQPRQETTPPSARRASPPRTPPNPRSKQLTPEQVAAEQRLREDLDARRAQLAVLAQLEAKDQEARAKVQNLSKELKGKEYSYDHKGQVVPLATLSSDGPVTSKTAPQFTVQPHGDPAGGRGANRSLSQRKDRAKPGGPSTGAASGPERKLVNDFREAATKTQPNPMQTLAPSSGVTLRGNGASKQGPARVSKGLGMSREELGRYAATVAVTNTTTMVSPRSNMATAATTVRNAPGTATTTGSASPRFSALPSRQSTAAPSTAATIDPAATLQDMASPTRRIAQGPGALEFTEGMLASVPDSPARLTTGASLRQPSAPAAKPLTPDMNPALVNAADWGRSAGQSPNRQPPLETSKPSSRHRELEVGRTDRLPRDRVSQATNAAPLSPSKLQPHVPQPTFVHG